MQRFYQDSRNLMSKLNYTHFCFLYLQKFIQNNIFSVNFYTTNKLNSIFFCTTYIYITQ